MNNYLPSIPFAGPNIVWNLFSVLTFHFSSQFLTIWSPRRRLRDNIQEKLFWKRHKDRKIKWPTKYFDNREVVEKYWCEKDIKRFNLKLPARRQTVEVSILLRYKISPRRIKTGVYFLEDDEIFSVEYWIWHDLSTATQTSLTLCPVNWILITKPFYGDDLSQYIV